jgi:glycosyltransferase involved in cell wall biosynthesis
VKILLIHSYYQQRGGEDSVFEQEYELLKQSEDIKKITFNNKSGWRGALQFILSIWNSGAAGKVRKMIYEFKPDIVQIYNWNYASGPVIIQMAKKLGVKVVVNVQNYRLLCPSASLLHHGKLFMDSIEKRGFPWKAVRCRVYRNSYFQTFWLAFVVYFHKMAGTWKMVDQYIAPSKTVEKLFTEYKSYTDIPKEKFLVKPNFSIQTGILSLKREKHFLFIGRLSEEKGIDFLLDTFKNSSYELIIAGSGPLKDKVLETCAQHSNIKFAGSLDKEKVKEAMSTCTALIFSSIWYEPFGLVITEALSNGCPLIASDIGSPTELVAEGVTGIHFKTGDKKSLQNRLDYWQNLGEAERERFSFNCISSFNELFTPGKNREQLLSIYHSLVNNKSEIKYDNE